MSKEGIKLIWNVFEGHVRAFKHDYNELPVCKGCGASYMKLIQTCEKCGMDMKTEERLISLLDELDDSVQQCVNTLKKVDMNMAAKMSNIILDFYKKVCFPS